MKHCNVVNNCSSGSRISRSLWQRERNAHRGCQTNIWPPFAETYMKKRLHSSRMRTGRSLTVCRGVACSWGVCSQGGLLLGGVVSQHALRQTTPPVNRMTDRCRSITLATTSLRPVIKKNRLGVSKKFTMCNQWRIYIVKFWTRAPPWGSKFFQFHAVFRKFWRNHMLAPPPGELAPPPRGNPRSATGNRHCN